MIEEDWYISLKYQLEYKNIDIIFRMPYRIMIPEWSVYGLRERYFLSYCVG